MGKTAAFVAVFSFSLTEQGKRSTEPTGKEDTKTMKLLKCEQEVHISFCADDTTATLYTSYPAWIRKMDKLVEKNPQSFQCIAQTAAGKTYAMPRNFVSIRTKERTVTLTEEQKAQATKRLHGTG